MPNPANALLKFSPISVTVPALSLGGTATRLFTPSLSASLANSLLQLFGYIPIQGLH